jgi:hypothetical protein
MSIVALESSSSPLTSLYQSSLDSQLISSTTGTTPGDPSTSDLSAITGAAAGGSTSRLGNLASDLSSLFKDLVQNNASAAKTDLTQLQKDLGSSATAVSTSSTAIAGSTPLQDLLQTLTASLSTGDTSDALKSLIGYFVNSGNATGNLVNTTA